MSRPEDLLVAAAAALKGGDFDGARERVKAALAAEPRLRGKAPQSIEELMPLLRLKHAAGPVLRRLRQSLGLSQAEAAKICGYAQQGLAHIEAGRQSMSEDGTRRLLTWMAEQGAQAIEEGPPPQALFKLRRLLGMTQMTLADKLGLKEASVRRMETGNMPPSMQAIAAYRRLAAEHGYDLDKLVA
jgi:transcriptional regulator with XRE-family HTH domain